MLRLDFNTLINQEASGFSLLDYRPINDNSIKEISLKSSSAFSPSYPIGSTINQNFIYYSGDYPVNPITLPEGVLHISNYFKSDYFDNPVPGELDLFLTNYPVTPSSHIFTIDILLENGTNLPATSTGISFN